MLSENLLEEELSAYQDSHDQLLETNCGKFVLIKDHQIYGVYENQMDAIKEGYILFGNVPFLVKQILPVDMVQSFVSQLLAV